MSQYLTPEEAASKARLSPAYLKKLRCVGGGPPYLKFRRRVTYAEDDLEAWLRAHTVGSTSEASQREAA